MAQENLNMSLEECERHFTDVAKHVSWETIKSIERIVDIFTAGGMRFEVVVFASVQALVRVAGIMIMQLRIPRDVKDKLIQTSHEVLEEAARRK